MKTGVSHYLWDMIADKIRVTGLTGLKLKFSGRKFEELSENLNFYSPVMYNC